MAGVVDPEFANKATKSLEKPDMSQNPPRFIIIGAGSRGQAYANAIDKVCNGVVSAVCEPLKFKRETLGRKYVWGDEGPQEGQSFASWTEFVDYEKARRQRVDAGEKNVPLGVDGAFVCVLDDMHREVVIALAGLDLHIMCEKPLATNMDDCLAMYQAVKPLKGSRIFSIGHVLRYSPHNLMLRKLLVDEQVIGDVNSVVHTEPVGWWHFAHSFVRGNWRNDKTSAPSLLTKSCHDIDLLLWLVSAPAKAGQGEAHLPDYITSTGGVQFFKKSRKPAAAGNATNCMKCPLGDSGCKFSAKNIYMGDRVGLARGNTKWPIDIVVHDIEDYKTHEERLDVMAKALSEDWDDSTPKEEVSKRQWYGRCVYETDNNVCDEQFVTITWPESVRPAKRVTFHMSAQTKRQCERVSQFYGEHGEIYADSRKITVEDFRTGETKTYEPTTTDLGHGGGDTGLAQQFVLACDRVKNHGWPGEKAQNEFVGCTLEEVIRSHGLVFAAEDARINRKVVDWQQWWDEHVTKVVGN
ncbi:hypothetical protein QQS21_011180 [Conoideocrella luteorostrata]|uniref:Gfo/Idh/MocA-like oxidoreductase N-terminal domain-containing protein n=1 Tax=Conoideocrella luteorostrata TaxID=1105319 RepID=A0AAJ0CGB9_9HYPO|nr:hypothetical protein QQS21_011180 [Conoideocrella luteorostrata]